MTNMFQNESIRIVKRLQQLSNLAQKGLGMAMAVERDEKVISFFANLNNASSLAAVILAIGPALTDTTALTTVGQALKDTVAGMPDDEMRRDAAELLKLIESEWIES